MIVRHLVYDCFKWYTINKLYKYTITSCLKNYKEKIKSKFQTDRYDIRFDNSMDREITKLILGNFP